MCHRCVDHFISDEAIVDGRLYRIRESVLLAYRPGAQYLFRSPKGRYFRVERWKPGEPEFVSVINPSAAVTAYALLPEKLLAPDEAFPEGAKNREYPTGVGYVLAYDRFPRPSRIGWPPATRKINVGPTVFRISDLSLLAHSWPLRDADFLGRTWHLYLYRTPDGRYVHVSYHVEHGLGSSHELDQEQALLAYGLSPWKVATFDEAFPGRVLQEG